MEPSRSRFRTSEGAGMKTGYCRIGRIAPAFAILVLLAVSSFADTYPRQKGIRITHYTFDVTLSDATDEIVMKEIVDVDLLEAGITRINLHLCGPPAQGAAAAFPGDPFVRPATP